MPAMIGGGRDNRIVNNIFINCSPSVHVDARGLGLRGDTFREWLKEAVEKGTISCRDIPIAFSKPPYSTRYPQLLNFLNDEPKAPKGNVISNNICVGGAWDKGEAAISSIARPYLKMENNIVSSESKVEDEKSESIIITDLCFKNSKNPEKGKFQLKINSPALSKGFKQIPFDKIGLYKNKYR